MARARRRPRRILPLLVLLAALGACAPLPDARPFHETTLQLRAAIAAGHGAVDAELRASEALDASADKLDAAWKRRIAAADGMVAYAESIVAVAEAGNRGAESVRAVATSLKSLAAAAGIVLPQTQAVAVAADAAQIVAQQIANVLARRSLTEAMAAAQPAVDAVAELLARDFDDMIAALRAAARLADAELQLDQETQIKLGYREQVLSERMKVYLEAGAAATAPANLARLQELDQALRGMNEWYLPLQARRQAIGEREAAGRRLLSATKQSVRDWAATHGQLADVIARGGRVDARALAESIAEIRELIRRVREL